MNYVPVFISDYTVYKKIQDIGDNLKISTIYYFFIEFNVALTTNTIQWEQKRNSNVLVCISDLILDTVRVIFYWC